MSLEYNDKRPYKSEAEEDLTDKSEGGNVTKEAETGVMPTDPEPFHISHCLGHSSTAHQV